MHEESLFDDDQIKKTVKAEEDTMLSKMIYIMSFGELVIQYDFCLN